MYALHQAGGQFAASFLGCCAKRFSRTNEQALFGNAGITSKMKSAIHFPCCFNNMYFLNTQKTTCPNDSAYSSSFFSVSNRHSKLILFILFLRFTFFSSMLAAGISKHHFMFLDHDFSFPSV